jgi:hypothetical protein
VHVAVLLITIISLAIVSNILNSTITQAHAKSHSNGQQSQTNNSGPDGGVHLIKDKGKMASPSKDNSTSNNKNNRHPASSINAAVHVIHKKGKTTPASTTTNSIAANNTSTTKAPKPTLIDNTPPNTQIIKAERLVVTTFSNYYEDWSPKQWT